MAKRPWISPVSSASDYERQARADFAIWDLLERADLLPPPDQLPTRRLINQARRKLGLLPVHGRRRIRRKH